MNEEAQPQETDKPEPVPTHPHEHPKHAQHDELEKLKTKLLHLRADFDNYKKRTTRSRGEASEETRREVLAALLPIYDNFERALTQAESMPELLPFLNGFELIMQQLNDFLRNQGLEEIPAESGTPFDPNVHDATGVIPVEGQPPNEVAHLQQKGYTYKGQIVRPASVMVTG